MAGGLVKAISGRRRASGSRALSVRLGRRTKALTPSLAVGQIAVIDHADLDTVAAQALAATKPEAVINNRLFVTGRYPNRGPQVLLDAGIPLFEALDGVDLFERLTEGQCVRWEDGALLAETGERLPLVPLTRPILSERLAAARANLDAELADFAENTLRYLARPEERTLLLDPVLAPAVRTPLAGRHALVVVRGDGYEEDLDSLTTYLREQRPAVIAVDGAADALLARGIRPDLILGDMDSVSDDALRCGAELVVHAYADGRAPGRERLDALGVASNIFPTAGTSEDAALLLAHEGGADLIVAVGTHTNLEDFLDKGRGGMASTFLVRLKVGSRLVDARGVSRLYGVRTRSGPLLIFLALAALFPVVVLLASTSFGQIAWRSIVLWFRLR